MRHCASIDHQPALRSPDCFNGLCSTASLCSTSQRALTLFVLPACVIDLQSEFLLQTDGRCSPLIRAHLLNECCVCNLAPSLCVSLRNCGLWHAGPNDKYSRGGCQHREGCISAMIFCICCGKIVFLLACFVKSVKSDILQSTRKCKRARFLS